MKNSNIGWLYYKFYYRDLASMSPDFKGKFGLLKKVNLTDIGQNTGCGTQCTFKLETVYPGLLIGSGAAHQSGFGQEKDDELKLGFSFDYTTGLPLIHGSSIKGLLRSMFPFSVKKGRTQQEEAELEKSYRIPRREFIKEILKKGDALDVDLLEKVIFEGVDINQADTCLPIYKRDVFFDAFPVQSVNNLLDNDYITPHFKDGDSMSIFKNPEPIQFLKVSPGVIFEFRFDLKPTYINGIEIKADDKIDLFKEILTTIGVGAKTNVGYGQFTDKLSKKRDPVIIEDNTNVGSKKKVLIKKR